MIKIYETTKKNKLIMNCKNGDFIQIGKYIHIICDNGTHKDNIQTMDLKTGLFYTLPKNYKVIVIEYKIQ